MSFFPFLNLLLEIFLQFILDAKKLLLCNIKVAAFAKENNLLLFSSVGVSQSNFEAIEAQWLALASLLLPSLIIFNNFVKRVSRGSSVPSASKANNWVSERVDRVLINQSDKIKICACQVIFSGHQGSIEIMNYFTFCKMSFIYHTTRNGYKKV